jgi:biopolymer transport protein ExbD
MKLADSNPERKAQIPIVPLIDVVFLLLAAFVVATLSMTMVKGMSVDLPDAKGELNEKDVVLIVVSAGNEVSVRGEAMSAPEAAKRASELATERDMPIVIRGDKVSDLGQTVSLIDELRAQGVKKLSFQVKEN